MKAKKIFCTLFCTALLLSGAITTVNAACENDSDYKYASQTSPHCATPMCTPDDANYPSKFSTYVYTCEGKVKERLVKVGCC